MQQEIAWLTTIGVWLFLIAVFAFVALNARQAVAYGPVQARWHRLRSFWFWILALIGLAATVATLMRLPYPLVGAGTPSAAVSRTIEAKGYQWYWELEETEARVGETVEFVVTSGDVNHGFGLYDDGDRMVIQAQAMPGYQNRIRYTFDKPGIYRVLCLEYCGLAHHDMTAEIVVTPQ